jgi:hypothetical protein
MGLSLYGQKHPLQGAGASGEGMLLLMFPPSVRALRLLREHGPILSPDGLYCLSESQPSFRSLVSVLLVDCLFFNFLSSLSIAMY